MKVEVMACDNHGLPSYREVGVSLRSMVEAGKEFPERRYFRIAVDNPEDRSELDIFIGEPTGKHIFLRQSVNFIGAR
jgi:hypothetical protein